MSKLIQLNENNLDITTNKPYTSSILMYELSEMLSIYSSNVIGKVLTILDASISDPVQRKALKDIVSQTIRSISYSDDTKRNYIVSSLSRFLRTLRNEVSQDESLRYSEYLDSHDYGMFDTDLEESLKGTSLG